MNMKDEQIDELFRNKLVKKNHKFKLAYWHHLEAILIAQRGFGGSAGAGIWGAGKMILISAAVAVIGVGAAYTYFSDSPNKATKPQITSIAPTTIANEEINTQAKTENSSAIETSISTTNNTQKIAIEKTEKTKLLSNEVQSIQSSNSSVSNNQNHLEELESWVPIESNWITILDSKSFEWKYIAVGLQSHVVSTTSSIATRPNPVKKTCAIGWNIALEAGANSFNQPFENTSISYFAGFRTYLHLGSRLSLFSTMHFENINQKLPQREYITTYSDFGGTHSTKTTVNTTALQYGIVGLNALYQVYRNHSIGAGIQYAYLINSNDEIISYNELGKIITNKNESGYSSVFKQNDIQLCVLYQYRVSKKLASSISYVSGLSDLSDNTAFKSDLIHSNSGLKVGIQYFIK